MKKAFFSTFLFLIFVVFLSVVYLSFFGFETSRFNKLIKSEILKSNENISLDFEKISILLDIKKVSLFIKLINPEINYSKIEFPLRELRADIDLESILKRKINIKRINISTNYLEINKFKPIVKKSNFDEEIFKKIKSGEFLINNLELQFEKNFQLKKDFIINGSIKNTSIELTKDYNLKNLISNFYYKKNNFELNNISWNFNDNNKKKEFFNGKLNFKKTNKYEILLNFQTKQIQNFFNIPIINYSFSEGDIATVKTNFHILKNKSIKLKDFLIEDPNNKFKIKDLHLDKKYNLINFGEIQVKTSIDNNVNNDFKISNNDKIVIKGKVFDAKLLLKELNNKKNNNNFLKSISKEIEIDFNKILKIAKFPIKNFRLIGSVNKGKLEKISAKSDFSNNEHLDILLKKDNKSEKKILEVFSDIATPLIADYKFFSGLDGGNLIFISKYDENNSSNELTINDFKLNDAPTLAKLLTLADLKGLTDSLKGEGISFDTLSLKYQTTPFTMTINEIFMIGPSISILIEGYIEKKSGLISLRGTLVPAKTLNKIVSKIPVVGEILVGKKMGEGVFGLSFKIKGLPDNLKTTVNPVKTLAPRFITRAVEAAKKRKAK